MWIRSQDKETLIKCENIYCAGTFVCCGDGVILGDYSTKEKALIVLDMIEKNIDVINIYPPFKMPQDSEVL